MDNQETSDQIKKKVIEEWIISYLFLVENHVLPVEKIDAGFCKSLFQKHLENNLYVKEHHNFYNLLADLAIEILIDWEQISTQLEGKVKGVI